MIAVCIDPAKFDNPVHRGINTLERLKIAGVPVIGVIFPESVEYGTLVIGVPDLATGEVVYTWEP